MRTDKYIFILLLFLSFFYFISLSNSAFGDLILRTNGNAGETTNFNLSIWDDTDIIAGSKIKYSYGLAYLGPGNQKDLEDWNVFFYANASNYSGVISSENSSCFIRFNETGVFTDWNQMFFNNTSELWQYNNSFNYKGNLSFQINYSFFEDSLILEDNFIITNTRAYLNNLESGVMPRFYCLEDVLCTYNFSTNITEDDHNDFISYSSGENTTLSSYLYNLDSSGILTINATNDSHCESKNFEIEIMDSGNLDSSGIRDVGILPITINSVNDLPIILNFSDLIEINESDSLSILEIEGYDEEENYPLNFSIGVLNCSLASWSSRKGSISGEDNCSFFSYEIINNQTLRLLMNVSNDFVGEYNLTLGVYENHTDNGSSFYNFSINILNRDNFPTLDYVCDEENYAFEDLEFNCWINASDSDESSSFFFYSNPEWFINNRTVLGENNVSFLLNLSSSFLNDSKVGNWSINVSVLTGIDNLSDTKQFWFFVENKNDSVSLNSINNQDLYSQNEVNIEVEATDDDLYIPYSTGQNSYSEELSFSIKYLNGSSLDWISIIPGTISGNMQKVNLSFYTHSNLSSFIHELNFSVRDKNNYSLDYQLFNITINLNHPPEFNCSFNFSCTEDSLCYVNLTQNVSDDDGDSSLTFSYINYSYFPSFNLTNEGIINFSANDSDVGLQIVNISVTDGKSSTTKTFYFNISNIVDIPEIISPAVTTIINLTGGFRVVNNNSINLFEDENATIELEVRDGDFNIVQKQYYNESLTLNFSIYGPNSSLLNFSRTNRVESDLTRTFWESTLNPGKFDNGNYTVVIYAIDSSGENSSLFYLNLSISETLHSPSLNNIINHTSAIGREFYFRVNASDLEDGNSYENNTFYFSIINLTRDNIFNSSTFNSSIGEINISLNSDMAGIHNFRVYVNDSDNMGSYQDFSLFVYNNPIITLPSNSQEFNFEENSSLSIPSLVNHSMGDNLTYSLYLDGLERKTGNYSGNNSLFNFVFSSGFLDETYGEYKTFNFVVFPSNNNLENPRLINSSVNLLFNITHKNSPLTQIESIPNISGSSSSTLLLDSYFLDYDSNDSNINQSILFLCNSLSNTSSISYSVTNWSNGNSPKIIFSSSVNAYEQFNITAYEIDEDNGSIIKEISTNSFFVNLTNSVSSGSSGTTSSGGGGSSSSIKYLSIQIVFPESVLYMYEDSMEIPVEIINTGTTILESINLTESLFLGGSISEDIKLSLSKYFIPKLAPNISEKVILTLFAKTDKEGSYRLLISASVKKPQFKDQGELRVELKKTYITELEKSLIFAEEMIKNNPRCLEITEIVKRARQFFESDDFLNTNIEIKTAIESCEKLIYLEKNSKNNDNLRLISYSFVGIILLVFVFWIATYFYNKIRFNKYKNNLY